MNLLDFAIQELKAAGFFKTPLGDDHDEHYAYETGKCVLELIKTLSEQGHSGMSVGPVISLFTTLAQYKPLTAIQGTDDEWTNVSEANGEPMWQNKRCFAIFKDNDSAWYLDAIVYRDPDGGTFTRGRHPITFPYTPQTTYVDVDAEGNPLK